MTKQDIENTLKCLATKDKEFIYSEFDENDLFGNNFGFEIFIKQGEWKESLVKYLEADQGYQTRESAREAFVLRFLADYLKRFIW